MLREGRKPVATTPLTCTPVGDADMRRRKRAIRLRAWLTRRVNK